MAMPKNALDFLKNLLACPTPSGYEMPGQAVVRDYLQKYADEVRTDTHGNVWGAQNPDAAVKVMLAGHCDEIGLMIMHVDDKGFLYFSAVGGVNLQLLQGESVLIHTATGAIPGVIGVKPIHLMDEKERTEGTKKIETLWIDIGATDKKDAEKVVKLGDIATVNKGWLPLRNRNVASRGFDNRIGVFVVAEVLRVLRGVKLPHLAIHAVSTVQEEIGLRGATTAANALKPDVGIAVDVGFATDAPNMEAKKVGEAKLGGGPIIHRGANFNHRLFTLIEQTAKRQKIPTQLQPIPRGSGTDANAMQMASNRTAAALVSIPNRYMHSPVETVNLDDVENAVKLIAETLKKLPARIDFQPV